MKWLNLIFIGLLWSCQPGDVSDSKQTKAEEKPVAHQKQNNIESTRAYLEREREQIKAFMDTNQYHWKNTGMGMFYTLLDSSSSSQTPKDGQTVTFSYATLSLNGDLYYSSQETGNRSLRLGKQDAELGLHDALKLIHLGDKALFILPSHLAFGVAGDQKRIPPRAPLLYEIEIIAIN